MLRCSGLLSNGWGTGETPPVASQANVSYRPLGGDVPGVKCLVCVWSFPSSLEEGTAYFLRISKQMACSTVLADPELPCAGYAPQWVYEDLV